VTIRYTLNRADVWRAYWRQVRKSRKLNAMQAIIAASVFYTISISLAGARPVQTHHILWAAVATCGVLALLPVYPLIRFKPHERTLTITADGIATSIGKLRGEVPWSKVASIARDDRRIYIIGKNQNSFTIPETAFASASEREEFLSSAQQWFEAVGKR
jgi:hypothetical protein